MKSCTLCNEVKPLDQFSPHKKGKLGRASRCKRCAVRLAFERGNGDVVAAKRCPACIQVKPADDFYRHRYARGGLTARCKACHDSLSCRGTVARQADRRRVSLEHGRAYRTVAEVMAAQCEAKGTRKADMLRRSLERAAKREASAITRQLREKVKNQIKKQRRMGGMAWRIRDSLNHDRWSPTILARFGFTVADLKQHMERQFTKGMDWSAFRRGEIHIDHIVPVRCFDLNQEADIQACWALTNLRPLWAADNLAKGGDRVLLV